MTVLRANLTRFSDTLHDIFMTPSNLITQLNNVMHGVHNLTLVDLLSTKKFFRRSMSVCASFVKM